MQNKLLRPKDVAERLNCSLPQIYLMARNGDLPTVRIGRLVRFREVDLEAFILSQLIENNKNQTFCGNSPSGL